MKIFLFALTLLTGSFPAFSQENCPSVSDTTQDFCYLTTVADLDAQANGDAVSWYRDATSTTPIPENEFLQSGTYYAGNESGTCTSRIAVTVNVETLPAPASDFGTVFSPPISSASDGYEVQDLIDVIQTTDPMYQIAVFQTEYGTATYAPSDDLVAGQSYFVGQTENGNPCYSLRIAIRYSPDIVEAPTAVSSQTFCEGATVADLVAEGTSPDTQAIRWYSTADSSPELAVTDLLIDGETYYASQIVNDEGDPLPPTESIDRVAVQVQLESADAGADNTDTETCLSEIQARIDSGETAEEIFLGLLEAGVPTDGTFSPSIDELAAQYANNPIGTFATTYSITNAAGCEDSVELALTVIEDYDAGEDNITTEICRSELPDQLTEAEIETFVLDLLSPDATPGGTFSPSIAQITTDFNNGDGTGTFSTVYTVGEGTACEDTAQLEITIFESGNAGPDTDLVFCQAEIEEIIQLALTDPAAARAMLAERIGDDVDTDGEFSNDTLEEIGQEYLAAVADNAFPFTAETTYTVGSGTCQDSSEISITVTQGGEVEDNSATICNADVNMIFQQVPEDVRDYYIELAGGVTGGTFEPSIEELIADYGDNNIADFTTIYTVGEGTGCEDSAELTITVLSSPDAGEDAVVNLTEEETDPVDLFEALNGTPDAGGTWTFGGNEVDATFDPTTETEGVFTYTVSNVNGCEDSATVTVNVGETQENCPEITTPEQSFCSANPTVADLMPTAAVWYDAEDATEPLDAATVLVNGEDYFAGNADGTCTTRGMVTISITDAPAAPEAVDVTFCAVEAATVAELVATGDNIQWYTDEALTDESLANDADLLVDGVYYATQTSTAGCESAATAITVTIADTEAPTLISGGNVFCESDRATIADLEDNVVGDGTITWYDAATGGNTLNVSEVLRDGTTYYAALTDTECESSVRLAVTVELESCPIVIPEAFSPNGDNINDLFVIPNLASEYPDYQLEVYNRWGDKVYIGNAATPDWNGFATEGSFGDGVLPVGVYFYILYYNDGETAPVQGTVYLSR